MQSRLTGTSGIRSPFQNPVLYVAADAVPVTEPVGRDLHSEIHRCVVGVDRNHAGDLWTSEIGVVSTRRKDRCIPRGPEGSARFIGIGTRHSDLLLDSGSQ